MSSQENLHSADYQTDGLVYDIDCLLLLLTRAGTNPNFLINDLILQHSLDMIGLCEHGLDQMFSYH